MKTDDNRKILKDTAYCTLLESKKTKEDAYGNQYAIERIIVKDMERDEIRLCLYKNVMNQQGRLVNRMIPRPLDVTEDELLELISMGICSGILSNDFISKLEKKI